MYNVILFTDDTDNIASAPPLGAYKCAHVLREHGYTCLVVNHFSFYTLEELQELIDLAVTSNTFLVGFSNTFLRSTEVVKKPDEPTPEYPRLHSSTIFPQGKNFENLVLQKLREKNPNIKTVVGGARVTADYPNRNIDYAVIGYSEMSIVNLADHLTKGTTLTHAVKNIWRVTVIDDRAAKGYDFVNSTMTWLPEDVVNHRTLPIEVARGCIFRCKFCAYPMNGKQNLDFVKSESVLKYELEHNYEKYGTDQYIIIDDTFNDHEEKLNTLLRVVESLKFQPKFWGYHRLDLISTRPQTIKVLHDIGVRAMHFGIESLNPPTAKIIGKGYDTKKQIAALEKLRADYPDIALHGSFIIGLPEESEEQVMDSFHQVLTQKVPLHSWHFFPLFISKTITVPYPSDIDKNYTSYGYTDLDNGKETASPVINWQNKHMNFDRAQELANIMWKESEKSDNFYMGGLMALSIASANYPGYSFSEVVNTQWKNYNFHYTEEVIRKNFVREYKSKLLDLVQKRIDK